MSSGNIRITVHNSTAVVVVESPHSHGKSVSSSPGSSATAGPGHVNSEEPDLSSVSDPQCSDIETEGKMLD